MLARGICWLFGRYLLRHDDSNRVVCDGDDCADT